MELFGLVDGILLLSIVMLFVSVVLGVTYLLHDVRRLYGTAISTRMRATFTALMLFGLMVQLGAVLTGVSPLYQLGLILMLAMPAGTFAYVVARQGGRPDRGPPKWQARWTVSVRSVLPDSTADSEPRAASTQTAEPARRPSR